MATIIQVNRVNTNRGGAFSDTITALQSSTALTGGALDAVHIPNLAATKINQGTFDVARIPDLNASKITAGTLNSNRLNLGTGLTINADGAIDASPSATNLSDVELYANINARNAATDVAWHKGDIAIVTMDTEVEQAAGFVDSGWDYSTFVSTTVFRVFNSWDTTNDASLLNFGAGDTIQFRAPDGTIAGSTSGGTDFVVQSVAQHGDTTSAAITVDHGTYPADLSPAVSVGDSIFIMEAAETIVVPLGTYIYVGTDQTTAAATTNADWELFRTPTASNLPASAIVSGTFDDERISTNIARVSQLNSLTEAFTGDLTSASTSVLTINGDGAVTAIAASGFSLGGTAITAFPDPTLMFVNGMKIGSNEITYNSTRTTATFSTPIVFPTNGTATLAFELSYLS